MCGRLICVLEGHNLAVRCQFRDSAGNMVRPEWEGSYHTPGYNLPPTSQIPVLFGKMGERKFRSMRWGLVPSSHTKSIKDFKLSTHNCRAENLLESQIYSKAFFKGQRCVIPADGFYEWSSTKGAEKIPYFVHRKNSDESGERNLLMMAGLYDKCRLNNEDTILYSASVITVSASESMSWLHHRMPALLETEEELKKWLHTGTLKAKETLPLLSSRLCVDLYPVSKVVNSVSTNGPHCIQKTEPPKKRKLNTLNNFFNKKAKTSPDPVSDDAIKKEDDRVGTSNE